MSSARRVVAVARKQFHTLRHDKRSLALMLVAPVLAMSIFGFVFGSEIGNVPVIVVNDDTGELAADVIANLDRERVDVRAFTDRAAAEAEVRNATARAVFYFPANFTEATQPRMGSQPQPSPLAPMGGQQRPQMLPPAGTNVTVYVDGSNSQMTAVAMRALAEAIQESLKSQVGSIPVQVQSEYAYAQGARYVDFFVPGIMAFAALMFTTLLTLLAFVGERRSGTLSRLLMTPVAEWEIVAGYTLAFGAIAAVQGLLLLAVSLYVFDAMLVGSLLIAILIVILMSVVAMSLGILLSASAQREAQAVQFIPLVIFPTFLLAGIFVPVEALPGWLQPLAWAIPPTHAVAALRDVMLRGWGLTEVWPNLVALTAFAVAFLGLSVIGLRRQRA